MNVDAIPYSVPVTVYEGTVLTLEAMAETGWFFSEWIGDLSGSASPFDLLMNNDKNIVAVFSEIPPVQYTLTIDIIGNGDVLVGGNAYTSPMLINEGTNLSLEALSGAGWEFLEWTGDLTGDANPEEIIIDGDKLITAVFSQIQYSLTVNVIGDGVVEVDGTPYTVPLTVNAGTALSLDAVAAVDWEFMGWAGDLVGYITPEILLMDNHKEVTAIFTEMPEAYFQILSRPQQVNLQLPTSQGALLVQAGNYPSDEVRYRLFSSFAQYHCWDGMQYVSETDYALNPLIPGNPSDEVSWWIMYQRGNNITSAAAYGDALGPDFDAVFQSEELPPSAMIIDPCEVYSANLPLADGLYDLGLKYVILGYDQQVDGTLITVAHSQPGSGAFTLYTDAETTIRRIEVRNVLNELLEVITGEWNCDIEPILFAMTGGGNYCAGDDPTLISIGLSGSEMGVDYLFYNNGALFAELPGTGNPITFENVTAGLYTAVAQGNGFTIDMTGEAEVIEIPLPDVNCPADFTLLQSDGIIVLEGAVPAGGTYEGVAVVNGTFDPQLAGPGEHIITYTYENESGCSNSCTFVITVIGDDILLGDANCDGQIDVLDVITVINQILENNPEPFCAEEADLNQDGIIDILDAIGIINLILSNK